MTAGYLTAFVVGALGVLSAVVLDGSNGAAPPPVETDGSAEPAEASRG